MSGRDAGARRASVPSEAAPRPQPARRVLYVVSLFPCWSETFIVREIHELLRAGVDVRIVSLRPPSEALVQSDTLDLMDRVIHPRPFPGAVLGVARELLGDPGLQLGFLGAVLVGLWRRPLALAKTLVAWWRGVALAGRLRALAPDLLHAHWATYPSTMALLLSQMLARPFSFTCHAHDIFVEDHLLGRKLREASFAVTISEFNKRWLAERYGEASVRRLHVVHCGVAPSEFEYRPQGREAGRLLAVGRLDEIKGFAVLVEACAQLHRDGWRGVCEIVGDGELRRELEERIEALQLAAQVRLSGALPREQVRERLYRAAVFVLPSVVAANGNRDGVPVALMEAMAAGLPVVSTRVSGIPELVRDGWSGLLTEPGDASDLARCLATLLSGGEPTQKLAARARATVEERFNVELEAAALGRLFEQAIAGVQP